MSAKGGTRSGKNSEASSPFAKLKEMRDELAKAEAAKTEAERKKVEAERKRALDRAARATEPASRADSEDAYFRMIAGARPLDDREKLVTRSRELPVLAKKRPDADEPFARDRFQALVDDRVVFEAVRRNGRIESARRELSADVRKRLREGGFPIDATLDLHGLSALAAKESLKGFLGLCRSKKEHCVKVVHGRGAHSQGGVAVLAEEVFHWLTGDFRSYVEATISAPMSEGGDGATLVLLVRKQK